MLEIGSVIDGKYKILNQIGKGGMSVVYLAINEAANKPWAIKEVRKDGTKNYEVVKQGLIVETDMLKRLNHPNLPSIVDVIDTDDTFLIVMDYIEGKSLSSVIKENGAQPQEYVIQWAKQLCDVLGYLHSRKPPIIYRDMKPSNVMLKSNGDVTLIDFGTAREYKNKSMIEDTTCLGTQGYAAPEQFGGHGQTDARTDIYNLGATIYHLVTGHNPAKPPYEMYPIRQWNPHLSSGLEQIIIKCTQRNPAARYQSCSELMYALEHYKDLDEGEIKKNKRKFVSFASTLGLSVALFAAAGITHHKETKYASQNYETYYKLAEAAASEEEFVENIEHALDLDATKAEAYNLILDKYTNDFYENESEQGSLSFAEYGKVNNMVTKPSNNTDGTRLDDLEGSNLYDYYQFCYRFGLDIWTGVENGGNTAKPWLERVKEYQDGEITNNKDYQTAQLLLSLTEYSSGTSNKFDNNVDYAQFWNNIETIYSKASDSDTFSTKAAQLYAYQKILGIISDNNNMNGFYGVVSTDKLYQMVNNIESQINNTSKFVATDKSYEAIYNSVKNQIPITRSKIDAVSNKNGGVQNLPETDTDDGSGGEPE